MPTIAPCKHLAQVQPLETLAFAGFVSKRDHHLKQTCINLWDETLQFVKTAGLEPDPAGKDNDYKGILEGTLETVGTYGAGAEVAKNLFKLSKDVHIPPSPQPQHTPKANKPNERSPELVQRSCNGPR